MKRAKKHTFKLQNPRSKTYYENVGQEDTGDARLPFGVFKASIKLHKNNNM